MAFLDAVPTWLSLPIGAVAAAVLGGVAKAFANYRRSLARDSETFTAYVLGTVRLSIGRYVSAALARQFGVRRYAELRLGTFPTHLVVPSVEDARIEIDSAYVRLSLSGMAKRVSDESLLTSTLGAVLVFGEPGSGKSSLTKKLFRTSCWEAFDLPTAGRLPVHVELRRLAWPAPAGEDAPGNWLYAELMASAARVEGMHNPGFVVESAAATGGLMVLLDGLDEVPGKSIGFATQAIAEVTRQLRGRCGDTIVITTARTQLRGALSRAFLESMDAVYTLDPFTPGDIFEFLRRWPYEDNPLGQTQRIFTNIRDHRSLAEMCTNPLVLSMYVAQDQRYVRSENLQPVRLPDTRTEFYSSVVGELLLHRRAQQVGAGYGGTDSRWQRENLLGCIALDHLVHSDDPANSISWADAIRATRSVAKLTTDAAAESYLRTLAVDTGIFAEERVGESMRFMHLTLCEYLAARETVESGAPTVADLVDAARRPGGDAYSGGRLWEVVVFAVSLSRRADRMAALTELMRREVPSDIVVRAVRESQAYTSPVFAEAVGALVNRLASAEVEVWDAAWFAHVRLLVGCFNDPAYLRQVAEEDRFDVGTLLAKLTESDAARLERLFDMWLRSNPAEALSVTDALGVGDELWRDSRLIEAMEQPELTTFAMSQFVESPDGREVWAALLAEAALRDGLVAQTLLREQAPMEVDTKSWHAWDRRGMATGTFYGAVLAVATSHFAELAQAGHRLPRVGLLAGVTPSEISRHVVTGQTSPFLARLLLGSLLLMLGFLGYYSIAWPEGTIPGWAEWMILSVLYLLVVGSFTLYTGEVSLPRSLREAVSGDAMRRDTSLTPAMLGIGPSPLDPFPAQVRYVLGSLGDRTVLYRRHAGDQVPDTALSALVAMPRLAPIPLPVATVRGTIVDLRGLEKSKQTAHLLGGMFPFAEADQLDVPAPPPPLFSELYRFGLLVLSGQYRGLAPGRTQSLVSTRSPAGHRRSGSRRRR